MKVILIDGISPLEPCQPSETCVVFVAFQQNFVLARSLLFLPTLKQKLVGKVVLFIFRQKPPCFNRVGVLETSDVPVPCSLPQMQNLGITLELDPKGAKITCPAFGLYSSFVEYSTTAHIVLDLTSLAHQPKSRERSSRSTKHVTFALSPPVGPDYTTVSGEADDD